MAEDRPPRPPRRPPAVDPAALERTALSYLGRFDASTDSLRRVLLRRIARCRQLGGDADGAEPAVEALIVRFQQTGYLDDRRFAENAGRRLARRGRARGTIAAALAAKGVGRATVADALAHLELSEAEAAVALARRRKLGPFRRVPADADRHRKELGILARAGFDGRIAAWVVRAQDEADLNEPPDA